MYLLFYRDEDQTVDVEATTVKSPLLSDLTKTRNLMNECERHVNLIYPDEGAEDYEEHISKWVFFLFYSGSIPWKYKLENVAVLWNVCVNTSHRCTVVQHKWYFWSH